MDNQIQDINNGYSYVGKVAALTYGTSARFAMAIDPIAVGGQELVGPLVPQFPVQLNGTYRAPFPLNPVDIGTWFRRTDESTMWRVDVSLRRTPTFQGTADIFKLELNLNIHAPLGAYDFYSIRETRPGAHSDHFSFLVSHLEGDWMFQRLILKNEAVITGAGATLPDYSDVSISVSRVAN